MRTRLKDTRKAAGYKQEDAASQLGVTLGTYRNWEQGRVVMNGEQLINAAQLFNTTVDHILMLDTEAEPDELEPTIELEHLYSRLSDDGQDALLAIARTLVSVFPKE